MTARQSSLFDGPPVTPPASLHDPRIHICRACRGPNASCGIGDAWFHVHCAPANFWPNKRGGAA